MSLFLKQVEDSFWGVTGSEGVCEGIFGQVFPNLLGVVIKCIDDELEAGRGCGRHCQGYLVTDDT